MELIEQAVFMSAEPHRSEDARRVVVSAGVREADAQEILTWGPTEETLPATGVEFASLHGHRLRSGAYAIGRTTVTGRRSGTRGSLRGSTHCLVVRPRTLARFAGNPLALWHAAEAAGLVRTFEELPARLDSLPLVSRAAIVDTALLAELSLCPGADWMAAIVQSTIDSVSTAVVGAAQPEAVIAGVFNCLPPECRLGMSFSIGLRFCARRPYRLAAMPAETEELERLKRLYNVTLLDLSGRPPAQLAPVGSWGSLIYRALRAGRASFFAGQLARRPLDFSPQDLPALALQMLEELDASTSGGEEDDAKPPTADDSVESAAGQGDADDAYGLRDAWPEDSDRSGLPPGGNRRRAHAPHPPVPSGVEISAAVIRPRPPSKDLDPNSPEVLRELERLDDLVFEAVSGNQASLDELKVLWPKVRSELGDAILAESREQYLRYALTSWERLAHRDAIRNPTLAMQSLEVLCVLFGGHID